MSAALVAAAGIVAPAAIAQTTQGNTHVNAGLTSGEPAPGGSTTNDRCVPTLVAAGVPLALLFPVALGHELNIPGLDALNAEAQNAIRNANNQVQQGLGVFDPEAAAQAQQLAQQYGPRIAEAAKGLGLLAAGAVAVGVIADACLGDGGSSTAGSSGSAEDDNDLSNEIR